MQTTLKCSRCGAYIPDRLIQVHQTQCRGRTMTSNPVHPAYYSSHPPYPHAAQMSYHPPPAIPHAAIAPHYSQAAVAPGYPGPQAAFAPSSAPSHFRSAPTDSDLWRRQLDGLRDDLLRKIEKSSELRGENRRICSEYVNGVKVYQNLVVYTYAHLTLCTGDRRLLDELKRKIAQWISWQGNDLRILRKCRTIKDDLNKLLNQSGRGRCPRHVSIEVHPGHIVPHDDEVVLRDLLVLCGRDYEDEFYSLTNGQAQDMVDLLEEALRNPSIDEATHGRLLRYIIRLSRKSGRLPCQLLLNIANPPRVDAPVGQGGSATIYKGSYNGGTVAIKKTHFYRVAHAHKDFVSEAVIWSHLRHENIVSFIGVMEKDHSLWLVSKWMFSGNVRAFLDIAGRAKSDLRHLVSWVAKGLCYLHTFDPPIVHGDLKGYNVLVDSQENACLTDFGISHTSDSRQILDSTKVGRREAMVNWIAPEMIFGNSEELRMTLESDMYAFACVVYEIYVGRTPFDDQNVLQCLKQRIRPSLQGLAEPIKRLIEGCWQHDPKQRTKAPRALEALQNMRAGWF
ncbi:kinase-like protein [Rhizopogon salebrosus TDB-379]|nr:kinase-like protein [Rhizopogon salebrosus TDB-379]